MKYADFIIGRINECSETKIEGRMTKIQGILEQTRLKFGRIVDEKGLSESRIRVTARILTPEEAIGSPQRRDYPIIIGREKMIEAQFLGARGHAFTDMPTDFEGPLSEVLSLPMETNAQRAIYLATLNAVLRFLGLADGTVHCKDEDPERCALHIAEYIQNRWGQIRLGLLGLNPAIAERMIKTFGRDRVVITDRDRRNVGVEKYGVVVWDGFTRTEELIREADVILMTGTTLGNHSFDAIYELINTCQKPYLCYGVTVAGISALMGIPRICPFSANE
jgi:hypothetical protein